MIINLNNVDNLEMIILESENVTTLDDIIKRRALQESLKASDIVGFQEITNLNSISFGHFILIEKILELNIEETDKLRLISPVLFRPIGEEFLDNEDTEKEEKHKNNVLENIPIGAIYSAFNRFLEIRKVYLYKTYNGVIYGTLDEADDDDDEKSEGTSTNSSTSARAFHSKKFFWQSMISSLANGDIFKFNDVVELPMSTVMPYFAEKRSLEIVEYLEHKASRV